MPAVRACCGRHCREPPGSPLPETSCGKLFVGMFTTVALEAPLEKTAAVMTFKGFLEPSFGDRFRKEPFLEPRFGDPRTTEDPSCNLFAALIVFLTLQFLPSSACISLVNKIGAG